MKSVELNSRGGTRMLIDCYENAPRELQRIGHFSFFCAQVEATLWTRVSGLFQRFNKESFA
jgi:hypothetical protein